MATALSPLSVDEYLHTSHHPDVDLVDGEIEERAGGDHTHHAGTSITIDVAQAFAELDRKLATRKRPSP